MLVSRTSAYDEKPCEEAFVVKLPGSNRVYYGVKIGTIDQLNDFINKYGRCIISNLNNVRKNKDLYEIEIYDDFRE